MSKALANYNRKRDHIARSARELFAKHGFAATSMDDIADHAGVTKQTVYRYYPSKAEMLKATLALCVEKRPAEHCFGERGVEAELYDFALHFIRFHLSDEHLDTFRLLVAEGRREPVLGSTFFEHGPKESSSLVATFLQARLPHLEDVEQKVFLFISMLNSLRLPILFGLKASFTDDEIAAHARNAVEVFLHGCMKEK